MNYSGNQNTGKLPKGKRESESSLKNIKGYEDPSEENVNDVFPDYPLYPPEEDIYSNYTKEGEVDLEHPYTQKNLADNNKPSNLKEMENEISGEDLDIPGAELDDEQEFIGSEDEENNYYSLGGDNHEDLDEYKGDDY